MGLDHERRASIRRIVLTGLRMAIATALLFVAYSLIPLDVHPHESVFIRLTVSLFVFVGVLAWEMRSIVNHDFPKLRAISALCVVLPLFIFIFAWIYVNFSLANPDAFNIVLNRVNALYFTITVFSTVGFGDITPKSNAAQTIVSIQMIADLILIAVGIKLIMGAAERGEKRKSTTDETAEGTVTADDAAAKDVTPERKGS